jgi:hypothetical protein
MVNTDRIRAIAQQEIEDDVRLEDERILNGHSLTLWRGINIKPSRGVAIFESGSEVVVTTHGFSEFESMLKIAKPKLQGVEDIISLFEKAAPSRRIVTRNVGDVLPKYRDIWSPPTLTDIGLEFFCNDLFRGKVEKVLLTPHYTVEVTEVGPGKRLAMR